MINGRSQSVQSDDCSTAIVTFHILRYNFNRLSVNAEFLQSEQEMDATVQVRQRGTLTLPSELRQKYDIQKGDTFRVVDLDGIFVFTPMVAMVPELAREIEKIRLETGLNTQELLQALREERAKYHAETYGND
jgi:bifunctional DNA-binding transcriptional regulator/antitoxin component of YhaV-PrlF toxin-antitoxin module